MTARIKTLWIATASTIAVELVATWFILHPQVDPSYRAYYIEANTDCWPRETAGDYAPGDAIAFSAKDRERSDKIRVCGWFYPDLDDGTWSHGAYSRLRFKFPPVGGALWLSVTAGAMVDLDHPVQRVAVSVDGTSVGTLQFSSQSPQVQSMEIPEVLADRSAGGLDMRFDYPDARSGAEMGANEDPEPRAIRVELLSLDAED